jgi:type I restriction modification DNA specificity domain protein
MLQDYKGIVSATNLPTNTNVVKFSKGDVLLSNIRPYLKKVWYADRNGGCSADVFVFKALPICNSNFLHHVIANDRFIKFVMGGAKGVKMPRGDKEQMITYKVGLPCIEEQKKIANLLSLLDERISTQNKIINKLQSLIKGIMIELQKQGQNKGNWRNVLLSKVLTERDERNTNLYQVFSVSVSRGVINQVDYLGRSFAARDTSKYNVVHYGDLVYTKSPTGAYPYGIVKQNLNQENVAVSPLYGVYIPNSLSVGTYLHEYFRSEINTHNYLHPLIQKGAKNTINITNQRFLENSVPMPVCANELLLISKLLISFNDKIKYQQSILQQYQKQKQYLLRQMFI